MKFCCFISHDNVRCWLPACHEGAADCRRVRFLLSVGPLAHLHASSLSQPCFSIEIKRVSCSEMHLGKLLQLLERGAHSDQSP